MQGRRIYPDEQVCFWKQLQPGDFGQDADGLWWVRAPKCGPSLISRHTVIEHEDGTITVSPSILVIGAENEGYHGFLERGYWREV